MTNAIPDSLRAKDLGPQPFTPGDVFVGATDVDDTNVDLRKHAGDGRILHYDKSFNLKGELRTGLRGLVIGIDVNETTGELCACDSQNRAVTRLSRAGERLAPWPFQPPRPFGAVLFDRQGTAILGVHSDRPGVVAPGVGGTGPFLYALAPATGAVREFTCAFDGGKFGFHRVTHMFLSPDGAHLIYVSENGHRVMQFDLANGRQLPDLFVLPLDETMGTCGLARHPDGPLIMATGSAVMLFDDEGRVMGRLDVPARRGWTRVQLSKDKRSFFVSNFFDGLVQRRDLKTLAVVAERDIGRKYSLTGIAEFWGEVPR